MRVLSVLLLAVASVHSFAPTAPSWAHGARAAPAAASARGADGAALSRGDFVAACSALAGGALVGGGAPAARAAGSGVSPGGAEWTVVKEGKNKISPKVGDLVAVRFKGSCQGVVFDDIMNTEEPYYVRVGGESLIKARDRAAAAAARARARARARAARSDE